MLITWYIARPVLDFQNFVNQFCFIFQILSSYTLLHFMMVDTPLGTSAHSDSCPFCGKFLYGYAVIFIIIWVTLVWCLTLFFDKNFVYKQNTIKKCSKSNLNLHIKKRFKLKITFLLKKNFFKNKFNKAEHTVQT